MKATNISFGSLCRRAALGAALLATSFAFAEVDSNAHWNLHVSKKIDWDEQQGMALIADFDGDGLLDLFYHSNNGPRIYRNGGNGSFDNFANTGWIMYDKYRFASNYALDYNCDGHVDILTVGSDHDNGLAPRVRLYWNGYNQQNAGSGYGWFGAEDGTGIGIDMVGRAKRGDNDDSVPIYLNTVAVGDYDHDGYPDLLINGRDASTGDATVRLYHNNAGQGFTEARIFTTIDSKILYLPGDIRMVDINNDGWLDIVINGWSSRGGYIYLNDEGQAFYEVAEPLPTFNIPRECGMAFNDFNGDGWLDFISAGYGDAIKDGNGGWSALLYMNTAGTHANPEVIYLDGTNVSSELHLADWSDQRLVVRDFDGDGWLDVIKEDSQRFTYYGTSATTFEEGSRMYSRGQNICRSLNAYGDVTGNGVTDVYVVDYQWRYREQSFTFVADVYENIRGGKKNLAPQESPANVSYTADGNGITVYWDDVANLKVGYNVVVETNDGKVFANLPVNTSNSRLMVGEGRDTAVRPFVGAKGYKLNGITDVKRVGVQTLSLYNETVSPIAWAD